MPEISIIVPVYKVEEYLPRCIDSILAQTFTDFELILVDDGSPDGCGKICDEYAEKDDRIVVIHKINGGVSSARNEGINSSTGGYIAFVDSDDVIHPKYFEVLYNIMGDADISYCDYMTFTEDYHFDNIEKYQVESFKGNDIFSNPKLSFFIVWNKLIKKSILNDYKFRTDIKNAEDSLFAFGLLTRCNKVVYVKHQLYGYFIRQSGAVGSIDLAGRENIIGVWKYILETSTNNGYKIAENIANDCLLDAYIGMIYASKGKNKEQYVVSKEYLRKKVLRIMFGKTRLNLKEKTALLIELL